ncbi:MAG: hypothetical protein WEA61_03275 [Anaerolineales bacterium]
MPSTLGACPAYAPTLPCRPAPCFQASIPAAAFRLISPRFCAFAVAKQLPRCAATHNTYNIYNIENTYNVYNTYNAPSPNKTRGGPKAASFAYAFS